MAIQTLSSLVASAEDLLDLPVEELAGVLLVHLNRHPDFQGGGSHQNFFIFLEESKEFGNQQFNVNRALMEAWAWLVSAGLLVEKAGLSQGWFFISRRGRQITSRADLAAYRNAQLLP